MFQSSPPEKTEPISLLTHLVLLVLCILGKACRASPAAGDSRSSGPCRDCGPGLQEQAGSEDRTVCVVCASPLTTLRRLGTPGGIRNHAEV